MILEHRILFDGTHKLVKGHTPNSLLLRYGPYVEPTLCVKNTQEDRHAGGHVLFFLFSRTENIDRSCPRMTILSKIFLIIVFHS